MRRRAFIAGLGAATLPLTARAQQAMPVIGMLGSASAVSWAPFVAAFHRGLTELGYVEGRNLTIETRLADGHYDRLPALAAELVKRDVKLLVAYTTPSVLAAKAATSTIPIVFSTISDPVQMGFVATLSRPGGNLTGVTLLNLEIGPKLLELMHELLPSVAMFAAIVNPANPTAETYARNLRSPRTTGAKVLVLNASTGGELDTAFAKAREQGAGGIIIGRDAFFNSEIERMAALSVRHAMPTIYQDRGFAVAGGLMSYASNDEESYRQVGLYTARILKGEKPGELPVVQTTQIELVINLKTAKALGLNVPLPLLGRADEVIE